MTRRHCFTGLLTLALAILPAAAAFAAAGYTQTTETYPAPDDCPPMCGPMTCVICTNTGTTGGGLQQVAMEYSLLVPATTPATDYGVVVRDGTGSPILLGGVEELRFDPCPTCPGPGAESPAPAGFVWVNFRSQYMPSTAGTLQFVPHPVGPPGTPLPAMFWVSDTADDDYGEEVTNLLSLFPQGTVGDEEASWGELKSTFIDE